MSLYFTGAEIKVNGSGLIAESVSISTQNAVTQLAALGYRTLSATTPSNNVTSTINITYLVEPINEPNLAVVEYIKTGFNQFNWEPTLIGFAGITGSGYLTNYGLKITPNDQVRASVSYQCFHPLTGGLVSTPLNRTVEFSGLADSWLSFLISPITEFRFPVYDIDYSFRAAWEPVYKMGQKTPLQVQFQNGEENVSLVWDNFKHIEYSGTSFTGEINQMTGISLLLHQRDENININLSGTILTNSQINGTVDDIIKTTLQGTRFF